VICPCIIERQGPSKLEVWVDTTWISQHGQGVCDQSPIVVGLEVVLICEMVSSVLASLMCWHSLAKDSNSALSPE
jgi:hypothetical protein